MDWVGECRFNALHPIVLFSIYWHIRMNLSVLLLSGVLSCVYSAPGLGGLDGLGDLGNIGKGIQDFEKDFAKNGLKFIDKLTKNGFGSIKDLTKNDDCQVVWEDHQQPHCTTDYEESCHEEPVEGCTTVTERE